MTLTYSLDRPGKISIAQTFTFDVTGSQGDGFQVPYPMPDLPANLEGLVYDKTQLTKILTGTNYLVFKLAKPTVGQHSVSVIQILGFAPTPTATGINFEMAPPCRAQTACTVKFRGLAAQAKLQLLATHPKEKTAYSVRNEKTGPEAEFTGAELSGISRLRIEVNDETMRLAAVATWRKSENVSSAETDIAVKDDGEIQVSSRPNFTQAKADYLPVSMGPDAKSRYLFGQVQGITGGYFRDYDESYMYLSDANQYSFSLIGAKTNVAATEKLRIPLPAANSKLLNMTSAQEKAEFINFQKAIRLSLPTGVRARARVTECGQLNGSNCGRVKEIPVHVEQTERGMTILPLEAQITGLWFLELEITEGKIAEPGFWKKVRFGFGHHHEFGKYPHWVFWFYFLTVILTLSGAIVFFIKLGAIKRRRAERQKAAATEENAIREIKKRDPAFDAEAFKKRGRMIAERIQHAWAAGDMRECRRFLSQGVYNRFRVQLKIMREFEKRRNAMADFRILAFNIAERQRSGEFDCLVVRLEAEARDTMVSADLSAAEAAARAKKAPLTAFVEYYSFMRRRDATTQNVTAIDACSRCGAPFAAEGEITRCKNCGAVMGSGTFDWVLAEITQEVEYGKAKRFKMPTKDISPDRIEDRASFVFWRDVMARITGKKEYISRDASGHYLSATGGPAPLFDIAVGAADLETYEETAPLMAKVRIKWSARGPADKEPRHRQSVLSLIAEPDNVKAAGFAEHSCETCGAPLPETDSESCAYCRSPIQRKNKDWLLDEIKTTVE